MASDRWRIDIGEPKSNASTSEKVRSKGINPLSFHKRLRNGEEQHPTTAEKELGHILHLAAHNEVVQKRKEFTDVQQVQRDAYHGVTSLKTFPLQDLAMDYLDEMREEYLGKTAKEDEILLSPQKNCKRKRTNTTLQQNEDDLHEKYTAQFLEEKYYRPNSINEQSKSQHCRFLPDLWSMEPRIFAVEKSSTGKRRYIVGNLGRFLQHYWRETEPRNRHYYELIRESTPCRLYFDLEYCKKANSEISPEESELLMTEFIEELCNEFKIIHNIHIDRSCVVDLDSSTDKKFSRHLIIHLPNGELFADACSAGVFAKRFVGRLAEEMSTGLLSTRQPTLAKNLFVNTQAPKSTNQDQTIELGETDTKNGLDNKTSCFVDLGVYTRNRLFRLMGSMKYGKSVSASLRIADENRFIFQAGFDNNKFYMANQATSPAVSSNSPVSTESTSQQLSSVNQNHDDFCSALDWETHAHALALTLVVPVNVSKIHAPILNETNNGEGGKPTKQLSSSIGQRSKSLSSRRCRGDSPLPKLDKFILGLSAKGGVQGKIRAWSIECIARDGKLDLYCMSYQMSDNRFCENIGRCHRSNNIIWNVDFACKTVHQTCHDPDCRTFRGATKELPEEVCMDVDEYLLDQELAELDEDKIISGAITNNVKGSEGFSDSELDEAIGDLDMTLFKQ